MAEALSPILPPPTEALVHRVLKAACERGLKLATAESCTGGLLASLLTDVPGCSHAFERGFVTYTDEAKHQMLGVPDGVLSGPGPVSEPAARAMAAGALERSGADLTLAVTGWMEAAPGQPAGRVWFASAGRGREVVARHMEFGDAGRAALRLACLETGLQMLMERLEEAGAGPASSTAAPRT